MTRFSFNLQRFAEVVVGKAQTDKLTATANNSQVYGLSGNDTLESNGKDKVILIGGSGNDVLKLTGGLATLNGGNGADTFTINYSASKKVTAVIEDFSPDADKLIINCADGTTPNLSYNVTNTDVILTDDKGYLNVTLKGAREANDYYDSEGNSNLWEVLRIVNVERENQGLEQLTLAQGLNDATSIRAVEIEELFEHTRPDGTSCFTAIEKSYNPVGENIAAGQTSPEEVMTSWMNSPGHRANILKENYRKLGVGYYYDANSYYKHHWVQMFGGTLNETDSISTAQILNANINLQVNGSTVANKSLSELASFKLREVNGTAANDNLTNRDSNVVLNGLAGDDTLENYSQDAVIIGGAGDDSILSRAENVTLEGGTGNDVIENRSYTYMVDYSGNFDYWLGFDNVQFKYAAGDGDDTVYGFNSTSTLKISGDTYSTQASGKDVLVNVGEGSVLLKNANGTTLNIKETKPSVAKNAWKLSGTTATYGTSSNTLITVTGVKSLDGISLSGKVVTVAASTLNKTKVSISGSGYKLKLASDVTKTPATSNAWSYSNSTATYKQTKKAYYSLAGNSKSVSYSKATSSTLATIGGVKSAKGISIKGNVITVPNSIINAKKVTVSGNYEFKFAAQKTSITGSKNAEIITSTGANATITGGSGNDSIKLAASAKNNLIVYKAGDGNDFITGFDANDKIKITSGTAQVTTSGDDVIFTVGKGKLTVASGADKEISYTDASGEHTYPALSSEVSISGKTIKLLEDYMEDSFNVADYGTKLQNIDASEVLFDIEITGNKLRNSIRGGANNETLVGGKGNDTLTGGEGSDVFIYNSGDGNDIITDYAEEDKINIASGTISTIRKSGKNVIFTVGTGKITVKGAASKTVTYIDKSGKTNYYPTTPSSSVIWKDKNTTAILRETYSQKTFTASDYNASIKKIDASAVTHNIKITGNGKANQILGGYENDTIRGGKGNDTLQGGYGADVFVYSNGDGKDIIIDYAEEDRIQITKGTAKVATNGNDVIFTIGSGKLTLAGAANKAVSYINANGKTKTYGKSASNVLEDDNFIKGNNLSAIVEDKAIDYSFAELETSSTSANVLPTVIYSNKK